MGLPSSLYTDRGSHYFLTPKAGEAVDKEQLTQVGRALAQLGSSTSRPILRRHAGEASACSARCKPADQGAGACRHRRYRGGQPLHPRGLPAAAQRAVRQAAAIAERAPSWPLRPCEPAPTSCASSRSASSPATTRWPTRGCTLQLPGKPGAGPLRQGPRQGAPVPRRHASRCSTARVALRATARKEKRSPRPRPPQA